MEFLREIDFARWMNLMFSLEENLTDGPVNSFGRQAFEGLLRDMLARVKYDKGWAKYDYQQNIFKARIWSVERPDDVIVLTFNPTTYATEFSGVDPEDRRVKTIASRFKDLFRMDITYDPMTMNFKFSLSAFNKNKK